MIDMTKQKAISKRCMDTIDIAMYQQGFSHAKLARETGLSRTGLRKWFTGETQVQHSRYLWLCDRFGVDAVETLRKAIEEVG